MFCQVAASEKEKSSGTPAGESKSSSSNEESDKSNNKSESKEATSNGKNGGDPLDGPSSSKKGSTHHKWFYSIDLSF